MAYCKLCRTGMSKNMARHLQRKHPYEHMLLQKARSDCNLGKKLTSKMNSITSGAYILLGNGKINDTKAINEEAESNVIVEAINCNDITDFTQEEVVIQSNDATDYTECIEQTLDDDDPELESKVKFLWNKSVPGKNKSSSIWNFFKANDDNRYTCITCNTSITSHQNNAGNMRRHLQRKHPKQFNYILKYETKLEKSKYSYEVLYDGTYKCNACDEVLSCDDEDQQTLFTHFQKKHIIQPVHALDSDEEFSLLIVNNQDLA